MFKPNFRITPKITSALMQIEACRQAIDELPIDATVLRHLRAVAFVFVDHRAAKVGKIHTNNYQVLTQVFVVAEVAAVPGAFSARATSRANESAILATPAFKKSRRCMPVALPFDRPAMRSVILYHRRVRRRTSHLGAGCNWLAQTGRCKGLSSSPTVTLLKCM